MKRFITYLAVLAFFAVVSLPTAVLAADVTDDQVSAAVAGGQAYLAAKQVTPVFGTGVMRVEITTSDFPAAADMDVGVTARLAVVVSENGTQLTLIDEVGGDDGDVYTRTSDEESGFVGVWENIGADTDVEVLTINDDGTFKVEVDVNGDDTYTATGTYSYDETEKYLKSGGNWSNEDGEHPVASTAFAVAALLETGYERGSDVIRAGILYILKNVNDDKDSLSYGSISNNYFDTYNTGTCLIALSLYNDDESNEMRTVIQNGMKFLEDNQNPVTYDTSEDKKEITDPYDGGWTYSGGENGYSSDLSNTQFAVMGLWYANRYFGKTIEDQKWTALLLKYVQRCQGWYNPALLVLSTTTSDFPDAFGPEQGTDHLTIAASADGKVDYTTDLTVKMGDSDENYTFTRVNGTGNETSIAGEWQTEDSDGTVTINFDADGTYTATGENTDQTETYSASGTYTVLSQTWNDQDWVKNGYDIWGEDGAFSYHPDSVWFTNGMLGAGLWCLGMIGQADNPMVEIAIANFNENYTWFTSNNGDGYYYAFYAMAKGLTATIGTNQTVGTHNWVQDIKNEMVDPAKNNIQTVGASDPVQNYWDGDYSDGGDVIATSMVLMSLAFADVNTPSAQKMLPPIDEKNIDPETQELPAFPEIVEMTAEEGVMIVSPIRSAIVTAKKELNVTMPIGAVAFKLQNVKKKTAVLKIHIPKDAFDPKNPKSFVKDNGTVDVPKVMAKNGLKWFKTDADGNWKGLPSVPIEIDRDAGVIRVTLTDNGPEDTNKEIGVIDDPGAPGIDLNAEEGPQKILPALDAEEIDTTQYDVPPFKGEITLTVESGVMISDQSRSAIKTADKASNVTMPIGAISFTLTSVPGSGIAFLTIKVPEAFDTANTDSFVKADGTLKEGIKWFKMDKNGAWKGLSNDDVPIEIDKDAGEIRVKLTDNGPSDTDGLLNGVIVDPGAPGIEAVDDAVDDAVDAAKDAVSSSSSGCFIQSLF